MTLNQHLIVNFVEDLLIFSIILITGLNIQGKMTVTQTRAVTPGDYKTCHIEVTGGRSDLSANN